ncbi:kazal-type serine protease inhibitor domain-containing protein 1-like [Gastrophryne carolinensis]
MFHTLLLVSSLLSLPQPVLLHLLPIRGWSNEVESSQSCGPCQEELCPPPPHRCPAGRVRDRCGCCWECANVEGQMCDPPRTKRQFGTCGDELRCQAKAGQEPHCICPSQENVCGTDRRTYKNICRLQEAARTRRRTALTMAHTGPCQEAPVFLNVPRDTVAVVGQSVILGCEVSAQPVADLEWWKEGVDRALPGDSGHIIVQSRGGPQRHQVTGWLQIHNVRQRDAGLYICRARNVYGVETTSARLTIILPDSPQASDVSGQLIGVFDVTDDEDDLPREGSGSHD